MNPEPSTDASTGRARRHSRRDLEVGEASPDTSLVDAEHCEVLGLDLCDIALVRDCERTSLQVIEVHCVHRAAGKAPVGRWAWVVPLAYVAALRRCEVRRETFVARDLSGGGLPCWKLEEMRT